MACPCETLSIRTCPPFANAEDVATLLSSICADCVATVPALTDSTNFCTLGFGGAKDDCCEMLVVFEGERIHFSTDCTNWYQAGCDTCYFEVVLGSSQATWCGLAQAAGVDTDCCVPMFFWDTVDVWMTADCVTFRNLTTSVPDVLDAGEDDFVGSAGSAVAITGSLIDHPHLADFVVDMETSGMLIVHTTTYIESTGTCMWNSKVYNVTTGFYMTSDYDNNDTYIGSGPFHHRHYQKLDAGVYTMQVRYVNNTGGCTQMIFRKARQLWFTIYNV